MLFFFVVENYTVVNGRKYTPATILQNAQWNFRVFVDFIEQFVSLFSQRFQYHICSILRGIITPVKSFSRMTICFPV